MDKNLRILVVDDEPTNQEVAGVILRAAGHIVSTANHGAEALKVIEQESFDLILMDIAMPVMDGLTAIRMLRENPATRHLPILCASAKASGMSEHDGMAAGCDHYLKKPFRNKDLLAAIEVTLAASASKKAGGVG
jgi:CheY-like chemotaxis protein